MSLIPALSLTTSTGTAAVAGSYVSTGGADKVLVEVIGTNTSVASVKFRGRMESSNTDYVYLAYRPYGATANVAGTTALEMTANATKIVEIIEPAVRQVTAELSSYTSGTVQATVYTKRLR